mgnify:FL=1
MASVDELIQETESRMKQALESMGREFRSMRTGRANPGLIEHLQVEYHGVPTPLNQIAAITAPESHLLIIHPWDKSAMADVEKAIYKSDLGLVPNNDGEVIRLVLPPTTEERRRELVRAVKKRAEDAKIIVRNIRRDSVDKVKNMEKAKEISQDENRKAQQRVQQVTDFHIGDIDKANKFKESELMEV